MDMPAVAQQLIEFDSEPDLQLARSYGEDLRVSFLGWRFRDPAIEQAYSAWRTATAMPFSRIGYIGSMPSWAALLGVIYWLVPEHALTATWSVGGWIVVLFILTGLTFWDVTKPWTTPLAAVANGVAGFLAAWLLHDIATQGLPMSARAGIMAGGVLVVMYFGFAIFRISPVQAVLGITPYMVFSAHYLHVDYQQGVLGPVEAIAFTAILLVAYFGGLFVCAIIELVTRKTYVKDEIIRLQQRQLSESRDAIRRYVPPSVAQRSIRGEIESISAPRRSDVTVLFCDIVGFTGIADQLPPGLVTRLLGEYLSAMTEIIDRNGGTVNEFAGDGLMALFGAPESMSLDQQASSAVIAGLQMQARMPELNAHWMAKGLASELKVRIGINPVVPVWAVTARKVA